MRNRPIMHCLAGLCGFVTSTVSEQTKHTGFPFCVMKKYLSVHLSWNRRRSPSIFLCFDKAISNSTRSTEKNRFMGEKQTYIRESRLNPPDRTTIISRLIKHGINDRQIGPYLCTLRHRPIANQYPQSIVHAREHCRNSKTNSRC